MKQTCGAGPARSLFALDASDRRIPRVSFSIQPYRKPVIRGTRLFVDFVIGLMADGWREADILRNYPGLSHDDLAACLAYARDVLRSEKVYPGAA
jgi:uncharacterized protein (DUF433 family)